MSLLWRVCIESWKEREYLLWPMGHGEYCPDGTGESQHLPVDKQLTPILHFKLQNINISAPGQSFYKYCLFGRKSLTQTHTHICLLHKEVV